jgi:hypothetical protein
MPHDFDSGSPAPPIDDCFDILTLGRVSIDIQRLERSFYRTSSISKVLTDDMGYHISSRFLVNIRQARALAGLCTQELDNLIAERVVQYPGHWGQLGRRMEVTGWRDGYCRARLQRQG